MFKRLNMEHLHLNCKRFSVNSNKSTTFRKSKVVAHRLSIHIQNIITPSKNPQKYIEDINNHVALFRDLLINVGQTKDCPELREKIRRLRCSIVEECKSTAEILISQNLSSAQPNIPFGDDRYLVLLFQLMQLFLRELYKSYRLVQTVPMDMKGYYENRAGPSNLGNVISEILLCKQIAPDFAQEELSSIIIESEEIALLLTEIQNYIPQELNCTLELHNSWPLNRKHNFFSKKFSLWCCISQHN